MLEKYLKYLDDTFTTVEDEYGKDYILKVIPDDFRVLFAKMCEKRNLQWSPDTFEINSLHKGLDEKEIKQVQARVQEIKENYIGLVHFEDIPAWYYEFLKMFSGMTIVRSRIILNNGYKAAENTLTLKPAELDGLFYIGQYDGLKTVPIFVNEEGNVFAFSAKEFNVYDKWKPTDKTFYKYRKVHVPLIGYWESMDDFLLTETKRLLDQYLADPQYDSTEIINPHNVTPEILKKLRAEGKIKY